jgi:hypothetical protein
MSTLFPGQSLLPGQSLKSDNGLYTLTMQSDGNVVLYNNVQKPLWWTNTGGGLIDPRDFIMQTDGNLVLYDTSGQARWNSKTQGNPGAFLNVQDDGNLVVYRAGSATETVSNALWSAGTNVPPPLSLRSVVDSGPMLNVGNADLFSITAGMISNRQAGQFGIGWSNTEQGSWSEVGPVGCGGHPVTVNVRIDATWDSGPGWNGQDLRDAFAGALWAVMQGVGTSYENYSYTELPAINGDAVLCVDPQFLDWGHHIPAAIRITAHDNNTGDTANEVTVRYSTQDQSGGDVCGTIKDLAGGLLPLFLEDAPAAIVGTAMTVICDLIDG